MNPDDRSRVGAVGSPVAPTGVHVVNGNIGEPGGTWSLPTPCALLVALPARRRMRLGEPEGRLSFTRQGRSPRM